MNNLQHCKIVIHRFELFLPFGLCVSSKNTFGHMYKFRNT
uniref:Uncharacterized protein n=2 Tax=Anguilla anguilla TaxID=7936 RepID=A0A0E9UIN9_ANGAN